MNTFTVEDLKVLVDMSPTTSAIAYTLKRKGYDPKFFHNMLWAYSRKEWSFVYEVPYDDLPLYVNGAPSDKYKYHPKMEGFLQWRLKIGK